MLSVFEAEPNLPDAYKKTVESRIRQNRNTTAVPLDETHLDAVGGLM